MAHPIKTLFNNSAIYGLGNMLQRFAGLLLIPLFTNYITPKDYGAYALMLLLGAILHPIFNLGMNSALGPCYFKTNSNENKKSVVWTALIIATLSALIMTSLAWLIPDLIIKSVLLESNYASITSLYLSATAISVIYRPLAQILQFERRAKAFIIINILSTILIVVVNFWTIKYLKMGIVGIICAHLAGNTLCLLLMLLSCKLPAKPIYSRMIAKDILRVGIPLIPSFAFLFIMTNSGKYALNYYHGEAAVGIFSIGYQLGTAVNMLVGALATAWYPFFMSYMNNQTEASNLFGTITKIYILMCGFIVLLCFANSTIITVLLTPIEYYDTYRVIGFIGLAYFFTGIFNLSLPAVYYADKIQYIPLLQAASAICSIIGSILLCPHLGILGAGLAMALSYASMAIGMICLNKYISSLDFKINYPWRPVRRFSIFSAFIVIFSFYETPYILVELGLKPFLLTTLSLLAVYCCLTSNEIQNSKNFLRKALCKVQTS